jgi:hypothetical protein
VDARRHQLDVDLALLVGAELGELGGEQRGERAEDRLHRGDVAGLVGSSSASQMTNAVPHWIIASSAETWS